MTGHRKAWVRKSRKALLYWTCYMVGWFLAMLFIELYSEGPEKITTAFLIARPAVLGVFWLGGVLVIRWSARGEAREPDRAEDCGP